MTDRVWALALLEGGVLAPWLKPSYLMVSLEGYERIVMETHALEFMTLFGLHKLIQIKRSVE